MARSTQTALTPLLLTLLCGAACSSNDGSHASPGTGNIVGTDSDSGSAGSGNTSSTSSGVPSASDGISTPLNPGAGSQDDNAGNDVLSPEDVCAAVTLETESIEREVPREITTTTEVEIPAPVAIYVVLDNSGSMDDSADGAGNDDVPSKWDEAVQALGDFVSDPNSAGVDVGIQYFHPEGVGDAPDECDGASHSTPAVDVGPLPDNAQAIIDSLDATGPDNDTPTVGALTGGTAFCVEFQAQHPDQQCIVVLVTDGQPNGCGLSSDCGGGGGRGGDCVDPNSEAVLTPIAAAGLAQGVTTFAVGMAGVTADGFQLLNAIAVAGGSDCTPMAAGAEACDVSATGGAGLLEALNTIRDTIVVTETVTETTTETIVETVTLPCQWQMPAPESGETIDPTLVNVLISIDGVAGEPLGQVPSAADCGSVGGGWYYDAPDAPTSISVCPQTCDIVTGNANVSVQLELGCATEIAIE